ncbi:hypothetical protein CA85_32980 [Allorhodopirellula solitaria]|uniref:Uncharacterized protein n=1 Tax=Allorhodopirellula solitaria TaxID=2527987 RepID=A0A5C5XR61_9BACT|nr:hypothetical protein CA85_32980 [Allorhodopirellula solitaria]
MFDASVDRPLHSLNHIIRCVPPRADQSSAERRSIFKWIELYSETRVSSATFLSGQLAPGCLSLPSEEVVRLLSCLLAVDCTTSPAPDEGDC